MDSYCSTSCVYGNSFVPSTLVPNSPIFTITENPSYREVELGRPLVGPAGKNYDTFLELAGISRSDISVANACSCVNLNREKKNPLPDEVEACRPRLLAEIELVNPRVLIVMGLTAFGYFFPNFDKVGKIRGVIRNWQGRLVIPTYHPAAALAYRDPQGVIGELIVEDLKTAKELSDGE